MLYVRAYLHLGHISNTITGIKESNLIVDTPLHLFQTNL